MTWESTRTKLSFHRRTRQKADLAGREAVPVKAANGFLRALMSSIRSSVLVFARMHFAAMFWSLRKSQSHSNVASPAEQNPHRPKGQFRLPG